MPHVNSSLAKPREQSSDLHDKENSDIQFIFLGP